MDLGPLVSFVEQAQFALVRTDFSDDAAWARVRDAVTAAADFTGAGADYEPIIDVLDDPGIAGATHEQVAAALAVMFSDEDRAGALMIADADSMHGSELTVVMMALGDDGNYDRTGHGRTFRCVASEVAGIEANLSISNMDFCEFADSVDQDGVFRGFGP